MSLRTPIPSNLLRLWAAGDRLMDWSAEMIAEETYLHEHLGVDGMINHLHHNKIIQMLSALIVCADLENHLLLLMRVGI